jgi:hypothetical protein
MCDKPVSGTLWHAEDLADHWDDLRLVSTAWDDGGQPLLYQDGSLARLLSLEDMVEEVEKRVGLIEGDFLFSGTLPLEPEDFACGGRFRAELIDPVRKRRLCCEYEVRTLPILDD